MTATDASASTAVASPVARLLRLAVRGYQHTRLGRPSPCRHVPSCSEYAVEALEQHGALRGSWLAVRRVLRCRPGGGYGFDPVPLPGATGGSAS